MRFRNLYLDRILRSPDDGTPGAGGGGGAPGGPPAAPAITFTPEQQAHLNTIVATTRREIEAKFKPQLDERDAKLREHEEKRAAEAAEKDRQLEEAKLAGMTAEEKLKHFRENQARETKTISEKYASEVAAAKAARDSLDSDFTQYVKRGLAFGSIATGAVEGSGDIATNAFLADSEVELDEKRNLVSVTVKGKPFTSMAEAAKHWFLEVAPFLAKAPPGGSGTPRRPGSSGANGIPEGSGDQLLSRGMAVRNAAR